MKWRSSIFSVITILLLGFIFWLGFSYAATETTVEKILENKDSYDGKEVSVPGTVSKLKFKTSKAGSEYTTFSLTGDSGGSINVFIWGHSKIKEGQKVKVLGIYRKVKKVGRYTLYNEIEAIEVK
jgi:hypothetical protein